MAQQNRRLLSGIKGAVILPACQLCPCLRYPAESRGGYIRVIIGKRDMTSGIQGASWYCAECEGGWVGICRVLLGSWQTRTLATVSLAAHRPSVCAWTDADRASKWTGRDLMADIDNGFDRVRG